MKATSENFTDLAFTYRLLSRLFKKEIDKDFIAYVNTLDLSGFSDDTKIRRGAVLTNTGLNHKDVVTFEDYLAADYTKCFIGTTVVGQSSYPYESVYTSPKRLVMQEAFEEVRRIYHSFGVTNASDLYDDHLGIELDFCAFLCEKTAEAIRLQRSSAEFIDAQSKFLDNHILNWVPRFLFDLRKAAETQVYLGSAQMLEGMIEAHRKLLQDIEDTND